MKISIITRHAIANYGSILQAYATEKIFNKLGYEAEIIDYIPEAEKKENLVQTYIKNSKIWGKNKITSLLYKILQKKNISNMNIKFEKYRKEILNLSSFSYHSIDELKRNLPVADIYCTGSDQVWGKIGNSDYDPTYFLDFVPNSKKCISYAASFGKTNIKEELIKNLPILLDKYSYKLVRENSAVKLLKDLEINNVYEVLDPTLSLNVEDWNDFCTPIKEKNKYIFVYQLHHNNFFDKYAKYVSKKTGLKLIRVNPSIYFGLKPGKFKYIVSPREFLSYIKNAEYILTDSFHGTVFSLLFNKKFIDILPNETSTRITSLLELTDLNNRIINNELNIEKLISDIDYNKVNQILKNEQEKTLNLLKLALKGERVNE